MTEEQSESETSSGDGRTPNHYEILGLEVFERDLVTIHTAVLCRTKELRAQALHPDESQAQRVQDQLNDVGRASAILEDPEAKIQYDRQLRRQPEGGESSRAGSVGSESDLSSGPLGLSPVHSGEVSDDEPESTFDAAESTGKGRKESVSAAPSSPWLRNAFLVLGLGTMTALSGVLYLKGERAKKLADARQAELVEKEAALQKLRERIESLEATSRALSDLRDHEKGEITRRRLEDASWRSSLQAELEKLRSSNSETEDALESKKKELLKLQNEFDDYKRDHRLSKRSSAAGTWLGTLTTLDGSRYNDVKISGITEAYLAIVHAAGSANLDFRVLPIALQEEYLFSPEDAERERESMRVAQRNEMDARSRGREKIGREERQARFAYCLKEVARLEQENEDLGRKVALIRNSRFSKADQDKACGKVNRSIGDNQYRISQLQKEAETLKRIP